MWLNECVVESCVNDELFLMMRDEEGEEGKEGSKYLPCFHASRQLPYFLKRSLSSRRAGALVAQELAGRLVLDRTPQVRLTGGRECSVT